MIHIAVLFWLQSPSHARELACDAFFGEDVVVWMVGSPRPTPDPIFTPAPEPDLVPPDTTPNIPDQEPYIDPAPAPLPPEPQPAPEPLPRPG